MADISKIELPNGYAYDVKDANAYRLNLGTSIPSNSNLNDYTTAGTYYASSSPISQSISNNPATTPFKLTVEYVNADNRILQTLVPTGIAGGIFYTRLFTSSGWKNWYKFEGTAVT